MSCRVSLWLVCVLYVCVFWGLWNGCVRAYERRANNCDTLSSGADTRTDNGQCALIIETECTHELRLLSSTRIAVQIIVGDRRIIRFGCCKCVRVCAALAIRRPGVRTRQTEIATELAAVFGTLLTQVCTRGGKGIPFWRPHSPQIREYRLHTSSALLYETQLTNKCDPARTAN